MRSLLASLLAAACLALVPAVALAQDAGSQQYEDPLAGTNNNSNTQSTASTSTPSAGTSTSSSGTGSGSSGSTSKSGAKVRADGLPRTGLDVKWLVLMGYVLLGGGLALRRVTGHADA